MMCASTNIPGFSPAEMPAATAPRESPIVLRRTPPRTPIRWLIHHVSRPAATSRRSPDGVAFDITSPSTDTTTREIPVHPDPQAPPIRTSRLSSCAPLPLAKLGRREVARDETESKSIHPRHQAGVDISRKFPIAVHQLRRRTDDNVFTERLHERHAYRRRREGVHTE